MSFSEKDIRPISNKGDKEIALIKDIGYLLHHRDQFVHVGCPSCQDLGIDYFTKNLFDYKRCSSCGTVFVSPRPSEDLLRAFYAQSATYAFWNTHIFPQTEVTRKEHIIRPRVGKVIDLCNSQGVISPRLLEVGAGYGTFAKCMREAGYCSEIELVELSDDLTAECSSQGFSVRSHIQAEEYYEYYDVIVSFETLEHMFSPKSFLQDCYKVLKPGGLAIITVPNFLGFEILTLKELSRSVDHEHINYFNPKSLASLFIDCGFFVVDVQTPGELDCDIVRNALLSRVVDIRQDSFLYHLLIDNWEQVGEQFQSFLKSNLLSSHLWVAGAKK